MVIKFMCKLSDMKCRCFCESESKLLENGNGGDWGRLGMAVELVQLCFFPVVIGKGEDSFWAWEAHNFGVNLGGIKFGWCGHKWARGLDVKEEVLQNGFKNVQGGQLQNEF